MLPELNTNDQLYALYLTFLTYKMGVIITILLSNKYYIILLQYTSPMVRVIWSSYN